MKKQFMRYRVIAEQKVGRANKSEVLTDELLQLEKHIEHVRIACQSTYKKLSQHLQSHGAGDLEKRLKRLPETSLAHTMQEASKIIQIDTDSNQVLRSSLSVCAQVQTELANERASYEMFVDDEVVGSLHTLVETDIPNVLKQREKLKRLVLDRDGAQQNYQKACKAQYAPGANPQQMQSKIEALKEEFDQAVIRMEQCKDQLVTDMFEYLSKEVAHGQRLADFHAKQLNYHRNCVRVLEKLEPSIKECQEKTVAKTSYGRSLEEHLKATEREIASPLEACVLCLIGLDGIKEEGIFRVGGGAAKLRKIKALVDGGVLDLNPYDAQDDIHAVSGALKQYLRDLPEPLLTHDLYDEWINCSGIQDNDEKLQEIWKVINKLPAANKANFRYLMKFCAVVVQHQDVNKMSASNLAVVLAPNLLWSNTADISKRMMMSNLITNVIESIIIYSDYFFPGDVDFHVTPNATTYHLNKNDSQAVSADTKAPTNNQPANIPLSPPASNKMVKSPSHSRNSSTDTNLPSDVLSNTQASASKPKRQKSKAPPPPQINASKANEKNKVQPPTISVPPPPAANGGSGVVKPPIAAKRFSMRKPQMPPPHPPKEDSSGDGESVVPDKLPKPKPRPPVRKHINLPTSPPTVLEENIAFPPMPAYLSGSTLDEPESIGVNDAENPISPMMPTLPPPPLPPDIELDMGASLTSELHLSNSNDNEDDDDGDLTVL